MTVGALRKLVVVNADTGIICSSRPRTYSRPMSLGDCRYSSAAFACTVTVPTTVPGAGALMLTVGAVRSLRTFTLSAADVV